MIFAFGIAWFAWFASPAPVGLPKALQLALYPFIGVDILKILLAATVLPSVWTLTGRSRPERCGGHYAAHRTLACFSIRVSIDFGTSTSAFTSALSIQHSALRQFT